MEREIYLDCNATTPVEPRVAEAMAKYVTEEFGNAGSRTHDYGARAKKAVERAREQVAEVVRSDDGGSGGFEREVVVFTSGATEANNLAIRHAGWQRRGPQQRSAPRRAGQRPGRR